MLRKLLILVAALVPVAYAAPPAYQTPKPMKIGIIGVGEIGGALARHWSAAGHQLVISSRHPEQLQAFAKELGPNVKVGAPREAWDYRLGNRSALEWILDQHKEKTPKDPTVRERFNTYRFADHKEKVIELLMRVMRVSVETVRIVEAMRQVLRA